MAVGGVKKSPKAVLNITAKNLIKILFLVEMSTDEYVQRFLSSEFGIENNFLDTGCVSHNQWQPLSQAIAQLSDLPIFSLTNTNLPPTTQDMATGIIKAISLHQPWATLITMGLKKFETRSWATSYTGPLLICAAKKTSREQKLYHQYFLNKYQQILTGTDSYLEWEDLPFGSAIAAVELTACIKMTQAFINQQPETEIDTGDWKPGQLDNIRRIVPPIPITGKQGLFDAEVDLDSQHLEAVA